MTRLGVWRTGVWAKAYVAAGAMKRWRRRAQAQRNIEISFRIARSRSQIRKMARARCSPLGRTSFESLNHHTRARKLERRAFRAWASHAERTTQASKQVRAHAQVRVRHDRSEHQHCKVPLGIVYSVAAAPVRTEACVDARYRKWLKNICFLRCNTSILPPVRAG